MKLGDMVMVKQNIKEFTDERGTTKGLVVHVYKTGCRPRLFDILWPDYEFEMLYEDEVELVKDENR
jgi:hypothetical protein